MSPTLHFKEVSATNSFYNYLNIKPIQKRGVAGSAAGWSVGNTVSSNGNSRCIPADMCSSQRTNRRTPWDPARRFVYLSLCLICAASFSSTKWPILVDKPDKNPSFSTKWCLFMDKAGTKQILRVSCWTNYNKDSSLALRMTVCIKITVFVKKTVCVNKYINIKKCLDYMS